MRSGLNVKMKMQKKEGRNPLNNIAENVCMYAEYQGKYMKKILNL